MILTTSGHVFTFGYGSHGQLGLGHTKNMAEPTMVTSLLGKHVTRVAVGWFHTMVLTRKKDVYVCGYGESGQLGVGEDRSRTNFQHVTQLAGKNVSKIFAGGDCCWALLDSSEPELPDYEPPSPIRKDDSKSVVFQ